MKAKRKNQILSLAAAVFCAAVLGKAPSWVVSHGLSYLLSHGLFVQRLYQLNEMRVLSSLMSMLANTGTLLCAAVLLGLHKRQRKTKKAHNLNPGRICLTAFMGAGAAMVIVLLLTLLPDAAQEDYSAAMGTLADKNGIFFLLVFGAAHIVLAPVTEEILFREILYGILRDTWGGISCILLVSCLFAGTHGNFIQIGYAFLMGIMLCLIREGYGSIWYTISFHLMFNLIGSGLFFPEYPNYLVYVGCTLFGITVILFAFDVKTICEE